MTTARSVAVERVEGCWHTCHYQLGFLMLAAADHSQMSVFSFFVRAEVQTLGLEDPFIENQVAGRWPEWETGSKLRIWKISPSFILLIYFCHCLSCLLFVPVFWYRFCCLYYMYVALKLYLFPAAGCLTWKNYKKLWKQGRWQCNRERDPGWTVVVFWLNCVVFLW